MWTLSPSARTLLRRLYPRSRVCPAFPHRLSRGGEAPSRNRSLKAKTQGLVKCFEGDKPWWPDLVMLVTGVGHKWSVQDLLPPQRCSPAVFLVCVLCVLCVCVSPLRPPALLWQRRFNSLWAGSMKPGVTFSPVNKLETHFQVWGGEMCERRLHEWLETLIKKKIITVKAESELLTGSF